MPRREKGPEVSEPCPGPISFNVGIRRLQLSFPFARPGNTFSDVALLGTLRFYRGAGKGGVPAEGNRGRGP